MAVQSFKGLGWLLCAVVVAPACYMVNSHGAAEQAKLNAMKGAILQAQKDIRGLETEFQTRANLAQIERWNGDVLALAAPAPGQYLASETALASLDEPAQIQNASLIVPAGAPGLTPSQQWRRQRQRRCRRPRRRSRAPLRRRRARAWRSRTGNFTTS